MSVDSIKMDLGDIVWGSINWIGLAQVRDKCRALENVVMNIWVPQNAGTLSSGYIPGSLPSRGQLYRVR
jgi:hypothetical protein